MTNTSVVNEVNETNIKIKCSQQCCCINHHIVEQMNFCVSDESDLSLSITMFVNNVLAVWKEEKLGM